MDNFRGFRGLAPIVKVFQQIFSFLLWCFELLYNRESFPANKKIMQLRNFSTANDLHYTVAIWLQNMSNLLDMHANTNVLASYYI